MVDLAWGALPSTPNPRLSFRGDERKLVNGAQGRVANLLGNVHRGSAWLFVHQTSIRLVASLVSDGASCHLVFWVLLSLSPSWPPALSLKAAGKMEMRFWGRCPLDLWRVHTGWLLWVCGAQALSDLSWTPLSGVGKVIARRPSGPPSLVKARWARMIARWQSVCLAIS